MAAKVKRRTLDERIRELQLKKEKQQKQAELKATIDRAKKELKSLKK